jgi:class 3 adenylate cyclase/pimeloyl-ACP methyl ester carboxylesterase
MHPETRYTQSGDVTIAYQVVGNGPFDLLMVPGFISHLELDWEEPAYARFLGHLSSFCRLIRFDKRGTGLSDRLTSIPTLEERSDDVRAVMDAAGSKRAALLGISEGGPMSIVFAATYPERTSSLILYGSIARGSWAPDYPWGGRIDDAFEEWLVKWRKDWGNPIGIDHWAPSAANDPRFREWWSRYLRLGASPSSIIALFRMNKTIDVRAVLPTIHVPTLVIHRIGDRAINIEEGRYLASHIEGGRIVEFPGDDHIWWVGDSAAIISEIEEFLTGVRYVTEADRVLATVLFTDIVNSTEQAAQMGDRAWRNILDSHNGIARSEVARYRGRSVKSTGDGLLAIFDGPARAIDCAVATTREMQRLGIPIRAGLHAGEVELIGDDIGGIAVHMAARVTALSQANEVWTSRTVKDLVTGSKFKFIERGTHQLKGVPGEWPLYSVAD